MPPFSLTNFATLLFTFTLHLFNADTDTAFLQDSRRMISDHTIIIPGCISHKQSKSLFIFLIRGHIGNFPISFPQHATSTHAVGPIYENIPEA
ncbi:hypothetical protein GDO81_003270 [Engystomops pustulosus]|uniref:Secreted protein n=1 Tax=Engystomops pustulosus TaxID=76066 RepID=A0AAV7A0U3_ENGPU|nr:hypothetical protein GDO81_003270 [Engystomops pustulosus]